MNPKYIIGFILLLAASALTACGGHKSADPNAPAAVTLAASRSVGLADGADALTVHATVTKADGNAVADGTAVMFTAPDDNGNPATTQTVTTNGLASVSLTRDPIQGATSETKTVTAASGGASGSLGVKFVNQPSSVNVFIAFNQAVTNLAGLQFNLNNTAGATFDNAAQPIDTINNAAGSQTLVAGNFNSATNSTTVGLAHASASGINTGTLPIIRATFAVSSGLPLFSVDVASAATFTATDPSGAPTTPPVTAAELVVTMTYDTE